MRAKFTKMQGIGNDYIYFNCYDQTISHPEDLSMILSDRHFGIGGDGIVLICPSDVADAKMRMFNGDGSEGRMCGNAIRCVGKYLYDRGMTKKTKLNIETISGIKHLDMTTEGGAVKSVTVDMGKAELEAAKIPVIYPTQQVINQPITVAGTDYHMTCVSMGNPHCVVFMNDLDVLKLEHIGPDFERHAAFPERVNTEFVQVIGPKTLRMRVWERGSGETWACGTGACATAVAAVLNGFCKYDEDIEVILKGGNLKINYHADGTVMMTGPAEIVFDGEIEIF